MIVAARRFARFMVGRGITAAAIVGAMLLGLLRYSAWNAISSLPRLAAKRIAILRATIDWRSS
jgi:hypothetical protein